MSRLTPIDSVQLGPRKEVRPRMTVALRGGGDLGYRGRLRVTAILQQIRGGTCRVYLEGVNASLQFVTAFVMGKPYKRFGVTWRPHSVSIPRK